MLMHLLLIASAAPPLAAPPAPAQLIKSEKQLRIEQLRIAIPSHANRAKAFEALRRSAEAQEQEYQAKADNAKPGSITQSTFQNIALMWGRRAASAASQAATHLRLRDEALAELDRLLAK